MKAQSITDFEQLILSGGVDLTTFKKAPPLKTPEEIRAEWLLERIGKFTASEFHRLVTYPNKTELPVGAIAYCTEKTVECLTEILDDGYTSREMQWGMDKELNAVEAFQERTGLDITHTGSNQKFFTLGSNTGGTPDGLIGRISGAEIKCPNSLTHFKYMRIKSTEDLKKVMSNYYWQIQGLMMITQCDHWYFISFDPRYKRKEHQLHFVKILPVEEDQWFLRERLKMAIELRDELLEGFIEANDAKIATGEVLKILGIGRTKLWGLRTSGKFPKPISEVPLLWKSGDIEEFALKDGE